MATLGKPTSTRRLAILTSHPIQYYGPLFRCLAERMDIHVFFAHRPTPEEQAAAGFGVPFDWDIDLTAGYSHSFLENVSCAPGASHFSGCDTPSVRTALSRGGFAALLITGWHLKSYWQGVWAAKRLAMPLMVRGDSQLDTPRSAYVRLAKRIGYPAFLRAFDAALYVGARNRAYYERYRYPQRRLFHSPHCVDIQRFADGATKEARAALRARLGLGPDDKILLFAGKLIDCKRPLDVVEICAALRRDGMSAHVVVAGSGPLECKMATHAKMLGIPLHLLGFQNQTQMPMAYAAADALILPSGQETWGLVCNEAIASSTPIVVSDAVGCAPDLAADEGVGHTFPTGDIERAAACVRALFLEPPSTERIAAVSQAFGPAVAAGGVMAALEYITACRSAAPEV